MDLRGVKGGQQKGKDEVAKRWRLSVRHKNLSPMLRKRGDFIKAEWFCSSEKAGKF